MGRPRRDGSVDVAVVIAVAIGVGKSNSVGVLRSPVPFLCELHSVPFGEAFWKRTHLRRQSPHDPLGQRLDPTRRRLLLPGMPPIPWFWCFSLILIWCCLGAAWTRWMYVERHWSVHNFNLPWYSKTLLILFKSNGNYLEKMNKICVFGV